MVVQGGGMSALKKLKHKPSKVKQPESKLTIPIPNQLMKIIRQCEVYLMEEAITDQIIKTTQMQIDPALLQVQTGEDVLDQSEKNQSIIDIHTNVPPRIVEQDEADAPPYQETITHTQGPFSNNLKSEQLMEPEMRTEKNSYQDL